MTNKRSGLWGAGFPRARSIRNVASLCNQYCWSLIIVLVDSGSFFLNGASIEVILQNVEKVVGQAVGAVAFAVFLHLGEHAAEGVGIDALFAGDFLFQFAQPVQFFEVGTHDDTSLFVDDAGDAPAIVGVARRFPHLLDQKQFFGRDKRQAGFFLQLEQAFEEFPTAFDGERAGAFVAVHAAVVAPAVGGVAEFEERFAELDQVFHAFVTGGEQAFAGFVALDDGAGPAAEAGVAAAGVLVSIWMGHSPLEALA